MRRQYTKPMILSSEEMAEGVFAGSGSKQTLTRNNFSVSLGNTSWKVNTYTFDLTNSSGEDMSDWSYILTVTVGHVTSVNSYNTYSANATLDNNKIIITPGGGTGTLKDGASASGIKIAVSYDSDSLEIQ